MSKKIKILIVVVALVAVFSVVQFADSFRNTRSQYKVLGDENQKKTQLAQPSKDTDGDGLLDTEESYWNTDFQNPDTDGDGFKDGEEVLSGHDPRVKGPNDIINYDGKRILTEDKNFTNTTAEILVGGMYSGDVKNPDIDKSISNIGLALKQDAQAIIYKDLVDVRSLITTDDADDHESREAYSKTLNRIAISTLFRMNVKQIENGKKLVKALNEKTSVNTGFSEDANILGLAYEELLRTEVPPSWASIHTETINLLQKIRLAYIAIDKSSVDDPLRLLTIADEIANTNAETAQLMIAIRSLAESQDIKLDSTLGL